jgi:ribosome biogenesis GTPase
MTDRYYHEEENFHGRDRKQFKKDRRIAQETDRSKFKKTDLKKDDKAPPPDDPNLRCGRVMAISGQGVWVDIEGAEFLCGLKGLMKKKKMQSKNLIAVGDRVTVQPTPDDERCIVYIEARHSFLSRIDVTGKLEQLIAVNIDQVLITCSVRQPPLKPSLIDRYLIATKKGNMHPVIVINKSDLLDGASEEEKQFYAEFVEAYERLGYPLISVNTHNRTGIENLCALMKNKSSVFSGQSGVGKSSLLNVAFNFELVIGGLAQKTFKGSHTTTKAQLLPLPDGGFCIDTPGIRSFGVWNLQKSDLVQHFHEFEPFARECHYPNCSHRVEPSCAVQNALAEKKISPIRFESYQTLLEETEGLDRRTKRKMEQQE